MLAHEVAGDGWSSPGGVERRQTGGTKTLRRARNRARGSAHYCGRLVGVGRIATGRLCACEARERDEGGRADSEPKWRKCQSAKAQAIWSSFEVILPRAEPYDKPRNILLGMEDVARAEVRDGWWWSLALARALRASLCHVESAPREPRAAYFG